MRSLNSSCDLGSQRMSKEGHYVCAPYEIGCFAFAPHFCDNVAEKKPGDWSQSRIKGKTWLTHSRVQTERESDRFRSSGNENDTWHLPTIQNKSQPANAYITSDIKILKSKRKASDRVYWLLKLDSFIHNFLVIITLEWESIYLAFDSTKLSSSCYLLLERNPHCSCHDENQKRHPFIGVTAITRKIVFNKKCNRNGINGNVGFPI